VYNKSTIFSAFILLTILCCAQLTFAQQSDIGPNSILGVGSNYGITPEERTFLQNQNQTSGSVPIVILDELGKARSENDFDKINELNQLILEKYSDGVRTVGNAEYQLSEELPVPDLGYSNSGFEYDWMNSDVLVDTGSTLNYQRRNLDIKYGDDGNMYVAHSINTATYRGIKVFRSTNGGQSWAFSGGVYYPSVNRFIMSLSMLVERRAATNDSVRVMVYYTHSATNNNDGAALTFFSYNTTTGNYVLRTVDSPPAGREFNYVSAVSDGKYYEGPTYVGCIVGDYSNDADSTYNINLYRSTDWGDTHQSVSLPFANSGWVDRFPNADQLPASTFTSDSIMIVTERDFGSYSGLRVFVTSWANLSSSFRTVFLTSGGDYRIPVLAIKKSPRGLNKEIIITCTKDSMAIYNNSHDSGVSWGIELVLDQRSPRPKTSAWTYVSSDSMGSSGDFIAIFSTFTDDSINVRRGQNGSLGSTTYKVNSNNLTGTNPPLCAIYRTAGNTLYSAIAYWGFGPRDIYYDAEQLITGTENGEELVTTYDLYQNYPNPFNPVTNIKFNLPISSNVTLKVFDILGREIKEIINSNMVAGSHEVQFNSSGLASGIYLYKLEAGDFVQTRKMILLK